MRRPSASPFELVVDPRPADVGRTLSPGARKVKPMGSRLPRSRIRLVGRFCFRVKAEVLSGSGALKFRAD
jgi:hypothetical protein